MSPEINREAVQPISPTEVAKLQREMLPPEVLEAFNHLLGEKALKGYARIRTRTVTDEMIERGLKRADIYEKGWLWVEPIYEEAGWKVKHNTPSGEQDFDPYYTFTAKQN